MSVGARRWIAFVCLAAPPAVLAAAWGAAGARLPAWTIRLVPFVALAVVALGPLLLASIAAAAGAFRPEPDPGCRRALVRWWSAAVGLLVTAGAAAVASLSLALVLALAWTGFVCYAISMGETLALQRARRSRGASSLRVPSLLAIWVVLYLAGGLLALLVPPAIAWAAGRDGAALPPPVPDAESSSHGVVSFDADGLAVVTATRTVRVAWSDVARALAFGREAAGRRSARLALELSGSHTVWLDDRMQGWRPLVESLPQFLAGAQPPRAWPDGPGAGARPAVVFVKESHGPDGSA